MHYVVLYNRYAAPSRVASYDAPYMPLRPGTEIRIGSAPADRCYDTGNGYAPPENMYDNPVCWTLLTNVYQTRMGEVWRAQCGRPLAGRWVFIGGPFYGWGQNTISMYEVGHRGDPTVMRLWRTLCLVPFGHYEARGLAGAEQPAQSRFMPYPAPECTWLSFPGTLALMRMITSVRQCMACRTVPSFCGLVPWVTCRIVRLNTKACR